MSQSEDRLAARDAATRALLPFVPRLGWTAEAARAAGDGAADLLFPGGPADMVAAYVELADREMVAACGPILPQQRLSQRVRTLIATRLTQAEPHRAAVRLGLAVLARPGNAGVAARCTAGTVDAIWHTAGDTSADFSWYTKRAILAAVYTSTLLFWVGGEREEAETLAFLDRRLAGVARLGKLRRRLSARFAT